MQVTIIGGASGKRTLLPVEKRDLSEILLQWLRSKGITIASSCDGEGVCKKCGIQNGWLTCELTVEALFKLQPNGEIRVSYL